MSKKLNEQIVVIAAIVLAIGLAAWALKIVGVVGAQSNAIGIDVVFEYDDDGDGVADGTDTLKAEELGLISIRRLTITDVFDRSILSAEFRLKGKVNWDGTPTAHTWSGFLSVYRDNVLVDQLPITNPATLRKAFYQELANTGSISKTQLELWCGTEGDHVFVIKGEAKITITFAEGNTDTKDGETSVNWKVNYTKDQAAPEPVLGAITTFRLTSYVSPLT